MHSNLKYFEFCVKPAAAINIIHSRVSYSMYWADKSPHDVSTLFNSISVKLFPNLFVHVQTKLNAVYFDYFKTTICNYGL